MLHAEYTESKFDKCFDNLSKRYTQIRRLRRDGNCFYRAFLFQLFEHFVLTKGDDYNKFLEKIKASKEDLVKNGGYDLVVIEDFYECFYD